LSPRRIENRVVDRRLADEHGLEAALERGVLLDVLAIFVERRRADAAQLAARERGLEHVRGVGGAFGGARADDRVQLVDEQDHLALRLGDLAQHGLEPVLELAAVLAARDQRADVERDQAAVLQALGHVARDDALGEALGDRGLADAGLADQHRVVLGAPREHLDHAADLLVAADDRIDLALARDVGEVAAELRERLVLRLGIGIGHARAAAHRGERLQDRLAVAPTSRSAAPRDRLLARDREQQVLGGDVLVLELLGLLERGLEHARVARESCDCAPPETLGSAPSTVSIAAESCSIETPSFWSTGTVLPSGCASSARSRCAGWISLWPRELACDCASARASWLLIVSLS
jgi:hypothetical protein